MRGKPWMLVSLVASFLVVACGGSSGPTAGELLWTLQFGTNQADRAFGVAAATDGRIAVAGYTQGALAGANLGGEDAFVRLFDADRSIAWTRQFGTALDERSRGVVFHPGGGVVTAGFTYGDLEGTNAGGLDAFVMRLNDQGTPMWTRQFGGPSHDVIEALAVAADGTSVVAGTTRGVLEGTSAGLGDAFVRTYDADGTHMWTRQFGTSAEEFAAGVATGPDGRIAVVGGTAGDLSDPVAPSRDEDDAFVRVYDATGQVLWTHQFGTAADDHLARVAFDGDGRVVVFGVTDGGLTAGNAGERDVFARAYDEAGLVLWTRQLGSEGHDYAQGVAVAGPDHVVLAGSTNGVLAGTSAGNFDAFVARIGAGGQVTWIRQFGTTAADVGGAVAIGPDGQAIVAGATGGALAGASSGGDDVFLRAYGP